MTDRRDSPVDATITPYCTVENAREFIKFLRAVFEAEVISDRRRPDGRIDHARVLVGTSTIMINDSSPEYPAQRSQLHVRVTNAEATLGAAMRAGAAEVMALNNRDYGDRLAGILDPFGNLWWIASPIVGA